MQPWWAVETSVKKQNKKNTKQGQGQGQGFFICHMINYTGYNQKWNVGQIRSAQWTVQRIKKKKKKIQIKLYKSNTTQEYIYIYI